MKNVDFGSTNVELVDFEEEMDLDKANKILDKKNIRNSNQRLETFLNQVSDKIQQLPEKGKRFPWRGENSVYKIYITEILLQRTHGSSVEKIYYDFFEHFEKPSDLYRAEESDIREEITPLGFQNRRTKCLKSVGEMLDQNNFEVPENIEKLQKPWRVGKYVAKATMLFGFDHSVELVDSNIASAAENILNYPHKSAPHKDQDFRALMSALTPSSPEISRAFYFALIDFKFTEDASGNRHHTG
jgi:A/G-specific adenine glycosylase